MKKLLVLLLLLLFTLTGYAQDDSQADIATIKASRESSNAAIARHDVDGMAKYWLKDFVQIKGSGQSSAGRDKIMAAWKTGVWTAENSYSKGGNYSAMWRKTDGIWKLQAELFVSLQKL